MTKENLSAWSNWRYDFPASIVVVLVALPLCLGIALASGAPLFSGLIAGVVGGVVVGLLSKSPLSVSGPAAGLTVIVLQAIETLPTYQAFLLAVVLAGVLQILFGVIRAGMIGDFIPSTVIKGMLAAIGIILILKQIPHAFGRDTDYFGDDSFFEKSGENTFSSIWHVFNEGFSTPAIVLSTISLIFLFWWEKRQMGFGGFLRYVPGPLVVVVFGILANLATLRFLPGFALDADHLVTLPIPRSVSEFTSYFAFPDFSMLHRPEIWTVAITLALVASIESLLSIEAVDKLDPYKRVTPTNRELMAQGIGNACSGLIGGIPVTSVIVRSSANVTSGARTKMSAILHGILLFALVVSIPRVLNLIPLPALAAVLIAVGYKLTKPSLFLEKYEKGVSYFIPFVVTIVAILLTDLLVGIAIGVSVGMVFILWENLRMSTTFVHEDNRYLIRFRKDLFFIHKYHLKKMLSRLPDGSSVIIDLSNINFIDRDNAELFADFMASAEQRNITVKFKENLSASNRLFRGDAHA